MDQEAKWIQDIQRRGSHSAADKLIRAYYDEIYVFVCRQVGNKEDAMDLTQDIFLAVLRGLLTYDRRKSSFRTWLYRVAVNKIIDARRCAGPPLVPLVEIGDVEAEEDFTGQVRDRTLLEQIERRVSGLDSQIQTVFRLRLYGDKPFPEIAAILGQPESTVKNQYYRLLTRLRKEFDAND